MLIIHYFLWFMLYSIAGWTYETILCSITEKKYVNRGFLNGPYCPIYGFGAVLILSAIGWIRNPFLLFFVGMVLTSTLEYFTAWLLEVLFHAKWWDYSEHKFNIKGRICLIGAIVFGAFSVVLVLFIHPFVLAQTEKLPDNVLTVVAVVLFVILQMDAVYTLVKFTEFQAKLEYLHLYLENKMALSRELMDKTMLQFEESRVYIQIKDKMKTLFSKQNRQVERLLKAFPRFRSMLYDDVLVRIKEYINSRNKDD